LACYNALPSVLVAILLAIEAAWGLAKFSPREAGDVYVAGNIDSERFGGGPVLTGGGLIWLSFKMLSGAPTAAQAGEPNTVGNPDFTLSVPEKRYGVTWPMGAIY
jgi:hypothetical protein